MDFSNFSVRAARIVLPVRALAGEQRHDLVIADLQVAQVQPLHAALEQGLGLARRVQVLGHLLVVHAQLDRVQREEIAHVHRQEHRHLRVGREQQLFLQHEQVAVEVHRVLLDRLDFLVERARVGAARARRRRRPLSQPARTRHLRRSGSSAATASSASSATRAGKVIECFMMPLCLRARAVRLFVEQNPDLFLIPGIRCRSCSRARPSGPCRRDPPAAAWAGCRRDRRARPACPDPAASDSPPDAQPRSAPRRPTSSSTLTASAARPADW